jgi:hypothetical protein
MMPIDIALQLALALDAEREAKAALQRTLRDQEQAAAVMRANLARLAWSGSERRYSQIHTLTEGVGFNVAELRLALAALEPQIAQIEQHLSAIAGGTP